MAGLGINWQKQKALLGLRGRLTLRQYTKEPGRIVNALVAAVIFLPIAVGVAIGTGVGYIELPQPWPGQMLGIVLVVMWMLWFTLPLFSFNVNEGLDPTRLLIYPLSRRDFVVTLLTGTLFDYPTYFMLPIFAAALIAWGIRFPLTLPVVLVGLVLSYLIMIFTSQLVVNVMGGLLQSRRFRDVMIIVFSLVGSSCWFVSQACNRLTASMSDALSADQAAQLEQTVTNFRPLNVLQWLPPGAAARAVEQASIGEWGWSLLWLLYAGVWVIVLAWVWWRVLQRIVTGEGFIINLPAGAAKIEKKTIVKTSPERFGWIPADIGQMALKELKTIWRTPQRRVGLLQGLVTPVIFIVIFGTQGGSNADGPDMSRFSGAFLPFFALFLFWATGQNMLGMEATGLPTLLLTPASRQRMLLGKSLALLLVSGLPLVLIGLILALVQRSSLMLLMIPAALGIGLVVQGVMSVASVYLAFPAQFERKTGQNAFAGNGGCLVALGTMFVVPSVIGAMSLPAAAPVAIGLFTNQTWLVWVGAVISLIYGPFILWLGTYLGGRMLLTREPELIQMTRPQGGIS